MAVPVVLGLPWLAGVIGGLFAAIFGWLAQYVTKRLAIIAAAVVTIGTLTAGLFVAMEALINGLVYVSPPGFAAAVGIAVPGNFTACVSAILSAHVLRWVYDWQIRIVQYRLL